MVAFSVLTIGTLGAEEKSGVTSEEIRMNTIAADDDMDEEDTDDTPVEQSQKRGLTGAKKDSNDAYNALSPKNQKAYRGLSPDEKKSVIETHKQGGDHQQALTDILEKDQKKHEKKKSAEANLSKEPTPAEKAMGKGKQEADDSIFD